MLTAESGRTEQATGEVRPHCGKISKKCASGVWHSGQCAIFLQRTLSRCASGFQEDHSWANLTPFKGVWAAHQKHVGRLRCVDCPPRAFKSNGDEPMVTKRSIEDGQLNAGCAHAASV